MADQEDRAAGGPGAAIAVLLALYFIFDFFFWDGGLVNPSIMTRLAEFT